MCPKGAQVASPGQSESANVALGNRIEEGLWRPESGATQANGASASRAPFRAPESWVAVTQGDADLPWANDSGAFSADFGIRVKFRAERVRDEWR